MSDDLKVTLVLDADGNAMVKTVKQADDALDGLGDSAGRAGGKVHDCVLKGRQGISVFTKFAGVLGLVGLSAPAFVSMADDIKSMNARLRQATGSQEAFNQAKADAKRIAQEARADYQSTVNLLSRLTSAADQYNVAQSKISATTEAVTYGLKLYGATAGEVASVQTQLSQALASGVLAGDEFKSMAEASPRLMQALADGLGVARGELKKLAADGELTTEKVINALAGQSEALKQEFASMPTTVGEAMGQLKNTITQAVEAFDTSSGISDAIAGAIMTLSQNLGNVARAFVIATAASTAFYAAQKVGAITTAVGQIIALERALGATSGISALVSAAMKRFAGAAGVATGGIRALGVAIAANPLGLLVAAIAGAITAFILFKDQIHPVAGSIASLGDYAHVAFSYIARGIAWLMSPIKRLAQAWDIVSQAIVDLIEPAKATWEAIGRVLSQFLGFVKGVVNKFIGFFVGSYKAIIAMWKNFPSALNGIIVDAVNWALEGINKFIKGTASLLNNLPGVEINVNTVGFTKLKNEAKGAADSVYAAFSAGFNADYVGAAAGKISETFTATVDTVKAKVHEIGDAWTAEAEAYHRLNEETEKASDSSKEIAEALGQVSPKADEVGNSAGKAGKKLKGMGDAAKKAAKALAEAKKAMNDAAAGLFAQLFPGRKLLLDMKKDAQTLANALSGNAVEAMQKYRLSVDDVAKKQSELNKIIEQFASGKISKETAKKAFDDMKKGIESVEEASKDASSVMEEQFKRAVESIDQSFADMWKSILNGGKVSFKALGDSIKNIMAEVLHGMTTKPLTGWITGLFGNKSASGGNNGQQSQSKDGKSIVNTLNGGFKNVEKTFTKGMNSLFGAETATTQLLGKALAGGVIGAGLGGGVAAIMGADNAGAVSLVSGLAGAGATALASSFGFGTATTGLMALSATGVGAIVAAVVAVAMSLLGKKEDPTSRAWVRADGAISHTRDNKIDGDITKSAGINFWDAAKATAGIYGVKFADSLTAAMTYKVEKKGGLKYYFDLFNDADLDGKRDGDLFYHSALAGDDANDPEKVAQAMAQMQVAALAQADWSAVSQTIAKGMQFVDAKSMSTEQISGFNQWLDQTILIDKAFGDVLGSFYSSLEGFKGSFNDFQGYTQSVYGLVARYGKNMVDDLVSYLSANPTKDYADTAKALNAVTLGIDMLGQTSFATNKDLIAASEGIAKAMGGADAALKSYQAIFNATATATHKAGMAYQMQKQQLDMLNASMGRTGDTYIGTIDALREYVKSLDPMSDVYAEQIRWAGQMATALTNTAQASKYFTDAITGITQSINGVITNIKEDMMSPEQLYNVRKEKAESLAASIASMDSVENIKKAADEAAKLVNGMWQSLSDAQQTAGVGNWMIDFLNEMETLAKGRIEELQNQYKAANEIEEDYNKLKDVALNMEAMQQAAQQQAQAGDKQMQAGYKLAAAAKEMNKFAQNASKASVNMSNAAAQINKPVQVDVMVHQIATGSEIN